MSERRFDLFKLFAFIPVATFVAIWLYIQRFDGWGAWGAAPLMLIPMVASLPITIAGLIRINAERSEDGIQRSSILLTLLASLPLLWFAWRWFVTAG